MATSTIEGTVKETYTVTAGAKWGSTFTMVSYEYRKSDIYKCYI